VSRFINVIRICAHLNAFAGSLRFSIDPNIRKSFARRFCLGEVHLFGSVGLSTQCLHRFTQRRTYSTLVKSSTHRVQCLLGRHTKPKLSIASPQNVSPSCRLTLLRSLTKHLFPGPSSRSPLSYRENGTQGSSSMPSRTNSRSIRSPMVFYRDTTVRGTISLRIY